MGNDTSILSTLIIWIILISAGIFGWRMLFDCINNEKVSKGVWIFTMIIFNIFVAIAYYFLRKRERSELGQY